MNRTKNTLHHFFFYLSLLLETHNGAWTTQYTFDRKSREPEQNHGPPRSKKERKILVKYLLKQAGQIQRPLNLKVPVQDINFMYFVCKTEKLQ